MTGTPKEHRSQVVTKTGDGGETGLLYGGRVPKNDLRIEACGALDEAVAAIGLARSALNDSDLSERLIKIQRNLFAVGAELVTDHRMVDKLTAHFTRIDENFVKELERHIARYEPQITLSNNFVIPGGSPAGAALDLARTFVRRCERRTVDLASRKMIDNPDLLKYLNRLSDLLFILSRYVTRDTKEQQVLDLRLSDNERG